MERDECFDYDREFDDPELWEDDSGVHVETRVHGDDIIHVWNATDEVRQVVKDSLTPGQLVTSSVDMGVGAVSSMDLTNFDSHAVDVLRMRDEALKGINDGVQRAREVKRVIEPEVESELDDNLSDEESDDYIGPGPAYDAQPGEVSKEAVITDSTYCEKQLLYGGAGSVIMVHHHLCSAIFSDYLRGSVLGPHTRCWFNSINVDPWLSRFVVGAHLVLIHRKSVLLIKEGTKDLGFIGGKVERGETLDEALTREVFEEVKTCTPENVERYPFDGDRHVCLCHLVHAVQAKLKPPFLCSVSEGGLFASMVRIVRLPPDIELNFILDSTDGWWFNPCGTIMRFYPIREVMTGKVKTQAYIRRVLWDFHDLV